MEASIDGRPMARGRTTFAWLEGGHFLLQRADAKAVRGARPEWVSNAPFPVVSIIGLDDSSGTYSLLYADSRGICRVYQMRLRDRVWEVWRDAPGFFQRFRATLSADGTTIAGRWEGSLDGARWTSDFDLTYARRTARPRRDRGPRAAAGARAAPRGRAPRGRGGVRRG